MTTHASTELIVRSMDNAVRGIDAERRAVDAVMSTPTLDRYAEIVNPEAFRKYLPRFLKAPRLLWNHDHNVPIGRWENVRITSEGLFGTAIFDTSDDAEKRFRQVVEGTLNTFSVAWLTHKWSMRETTGPDGQKCNVRHYDEVELVECSLTTIPANPDAMIRMAAAAMLDGQSKTLQTFIDEAVERAVSKHLTAGHGGSRQSPVHQDATGDRGSDGYFAASYFGDLDVFGGGGDSGGDFEDEPDPEDTDHQAGDDSELKSLLRAALG